MQLQGLSISKDDPEEMRLSKVDRKKAVIKFEVTQMTTWPSKFFEPQP